MQPLIIDAWGQHPNEQFLTQPMFASLQRWGAFPRDSNAALSVRSTLRAMDEAHVQTMCACPSLRA